MSEKKAEPYKLTQVPFSPEGERPVIVLPTPTTIQPFENWGVLNIVSGIAALPLIPSGQLKVKRVTLIADLANAGVIFVADKAPSAAAPPLSHGVPLNAADVVTLFIDDLSKIQHIATIAAQNMVAIFYW